MTPTAPSGEEVREVSVYDGHVAFKIPADWEAIAPEVLDSHSMRLAETSGGRITEIYQFGFRSSNPESDFFLPECLVQIKESGRLSYRRFLRLPSTEDMGKTGRETIDERAGRAVREMVLRDANFDHASFSLRLRNKLVLSNKNKASVKSVSFLTERGLFTMHFYSRVEASRAMDEISSRIIDSVRFDDELTYRPRFLDRWPPSPAAVLVTLGSVIALAALAFHFLQRRRKQS